MRGLPQRALTVVSLVAEFAAARKTFGILPALTLQRVLAMLLRVQSLGGTGMKTHGSTFRSRQCMTLPFSIHRP